MFSASCVVVTASAVSNVVAPSRMAKILDMFSSSKRNLRVINECHVSECVRSSFAFTSNLDKQVKRTSPESKLVGSHMMMLKMELFQLFWFGQSLMNSAILNRILYLSASRPRR